MTLPERIDRAAIERVIQRAAELQTGEREIGDGLTAEEVYALGREVGIPEPYLRQALLEERGRIARPAPSGLLDRTFGAAAVTAQRVVRGDPEGVVGRLLGWMEHHELLAVQRKQTGRITWEPLRGIAVAIRRSSAVFGGGRTFILHRAQLVTATVTALEPGFTLVALSADLRAARGAVVGGVAGVLALGGAVTATLAVMSPFWWVAIAPVPMFLGLGWGIGRQFRPSATRTLLGLERALDHLERGEIKPAHALPPRPAGLLGAVLGEVRKALE